MKWGIEQVIFTACTLTTVMERQNPRPHKMETHSKQLWSHTNTQANIHTRTAYDLFSLVQWQPRGQQQQCCSDSNSYPHHIFRHLPSLPVHLETPQAHHCFTTRAKRATTSHCTNSLWHWLLENVCLANRNGFNSASRPFWSYGESLVCVVLVTRGCICLLNNRDVECKCIWQIDDETKTSSGHCIQRHSSWMSYNLTQKYSSDLQRRNRADPATLLIMLGRPVYVCAHASACACITQMFVIFWLGAH